MLHELLDVAQSAQSLGYLTSALNILRSPNLSNSNLKAISQESISLFACWFQPGFISQPTVFSSHNKSASAGLISLETNKRMG